MTRKKIHYLKTSHLRQEEQQPHFFHEHSEVAQIRQHEFNELVSNVFVTLLLKGVRTKVSQKKNNSNQHCSILHSTVDKFLQFSTRCKFYFAQPADFGGTLDALADN